jgi:hypothetical protein
MFWPGFMDSAPSTGKRQRLILMVREPRAGQVKTRLAREIGTGPALRFYRAATANLIRRLGHDPRWQLVLAVSPDSAVHSRAWPRAIPRMPQGRGDLGARMGRLLHARGPLSAILIGSDIPAVSARQIWDAFNILASHDAVFGPARDGGYWLVGLKPHKPLGRLFDGVRWSSPHALGDTLKNLSGRNAGFAATLSDVDDRKSYFENAAAGMLATPPKQTFLGCPTNARLESFVFAKPGRPSPPARGHAFANSA